MLPSQFFLQHWVWQQRLYTWFSWVAVLWVASAELGGVSVVAWPNVQEGEGGVYRQLASKRKAQENLPEACMQALL